MFALASVMPTIISIIFRRQSPSFKCLRSTLKLIAGRIGRLKFANLKYQLDLVLLVRLTQPGDDRNLKVVSHELGLGFI